ncbi:MAG: hypothetical protein SPL49_05675 [Oribacterium sp.]|jgi:hypothetical protein|nr:hypothetical protein [Oribacterium sp.]MDY6307150.1 hypothetical protein [Oribacterium sp.]MDY6316691.1 hypothetical protein [Oribacterium sp.]
MSATLEKEAKDLWSSLTDEDAKLIIALMRKLTSSTTQEEISKVKIGLGKDKITYPDQFECWNDEVESMFKGYL